MKLAIKSKPMEQNHQCKFCGKKFHKEVTLSTHMCVKKQRNLDINTSSSRFGFLAFRRFFELTTNSKTPKTHQDFIDSQYYTDFVKFGNYLAQLKPVYMDQFIDFVIKNGVKLKDWTRDYVYYAYVEELVKKEPAVSAVERSITEIMDWCNSNNVEFTEFFTKISANESAFMIQYGKLSPWVLYLSSSADDLMKSFTEDHSKMIGGIIDPGVWSRKFKRQDDDVEYIRTLLQQAGL